MNNDAILRNPAAALEEALDLRATDIVIAEKALKEIIEVCHGQVSPTDEEPSEFVDIGRTCQYYLALMLSQLGRHEEANGYLRAMGYKHKLRASIFDRSAAEPSTGHEACMRAVDGAITPSMLKRLKRAFGEKSPFWEEHQYPYPMFFSYAQDIGAPVKDLMGELIETLRPLVEKLPWVDGKLKFAEWWAHSRETDAGHHLHWDMDELTLRAFNTPLFPATSTIIYLSEGDDQGETLITNQELECYPAENGWLATPAEGRAVFFDGRMLHGVLPGMPWKTTTPTRRLTLMIGWWAEDPENPPMAREPPRQKKDHVMLYPMMSLPTTKMRWYQFHKSLVGGSVKPLKNITDVLPRGTGKVWEDIPCEPEEQKAFPESEELVLTSGFFVKEMADVDCSIYPEEEESGVECDSDGDFDDSDEDSDEEDGEYSDSAAGADDGVMSLAVARKIAELQSAQMHKLQVAAKNKKRGIVTEEPDPSEFMSLEEAMAIATKQAGQMKKLQGKEKPPAKKAKRS